MGPVFVTGGSGFVARHIIRKLLTSGCEIGALVHKTPVEEHPRVRPVAGDLGEPESYARALDGCSAVVNAAVGEGCGSEVMVRLLEASARANVDQFVHLSTISIYGHPLSGIITEETKASCDG